MWAVLDKPPATSHHHFTCTQIAFYLVLSPPLRSLRYSALCLTCYALEQWNSE